MSSNRTILAVALTACACLLSACGGGSDSSSGSAAIKSGDELIAAAKAEGKLTWYTGSAPQDANTMAKAFTDKYGIKVDVVRLSSGPIAQRIATEAKTGNVNAGVIVGTDPIFLDSATAEGWLAKLDPAQVPSIKAFPAKYKTDTYATAIVGPALGVSYNTQLVKGDPPCSWNALLDQKYAGRMILTDPATSAAYTKFFDVVLHDPTLGEDWMKKFAALGYASVAESSVPAAQLVAAGEGTLSIVSSQPAIAPLVAQKAPIAFCPLESPAPANLQYIAALAKAPQPNAARLFVDYFLSTEGQTKYAATGEGASALGDLPGAPRTPKGLVIPDANQSQKDLPTIQSLLGTH